jgi:cell division protease FtsH
MKIQIIKYILFILVNQASAYLSLMNIFQLDKYKNTLENRPINELIDNIDTNQIEKLFINNDHKEIVSIDKITIDPLLQNIIDKSTDNYHITTIDPLLLPNIIDKTLDKHIEITFFNSNLNSILKLLYFGLDYLLIPSLIFMYISTIFSRQININNISKNNFGNKFNPLNFGNVDNKINTFNAEKYNITLNSWVGSPEVFQEVYEVVDFLKNNTIYQEIGAELPKGILLEGPPGTGKTLLAKAIASETNSSFISISGSEFIEMFIGMGASRVRNLFSDARKNSPCIVFIDEIDAVGKQRNSGLNMGNDEREQTLNQLLAEMDGFQENDGIVVIAATNRKDVLDDALLRPGRFDRIITVSLPDIISREKILNFYLDKKKIANDIDIKSIAEDIDGYSGAKIKNLINEAAILAARQGKTVIDNIDIINSIEKQTVGLERNQEARSIDTIHRVAIHEIGHAFLVLMYPDIFDLRKISIKSTYSGAGGYTLFTEKTEIKEGGMYTYDILFKRLVISMGGKAAESIFFGKKHVSVGATQDLKVSNDLARKMITIFGMGKNLNAFYNDETEGNQFYNKYSENIKKNIDEESLELVNLAYTEAERLINNNIEKFRKLVVLLMQQKVLHKNDIIL